MDLLDSGCYAFFSVFKVEGGIPLGAGADFDSTVVSVFLLKFQDQFDGVPLHLAFGEDDFGNLFDFLIGVAIWAGVKLIVLLNFLGTRVCKFRGISVRIDYDKVWSGVGIEGELLSIPIHLCRLFIIGQAI